jgi:cullin 3
VDAVRQNEKEKVRKGVPLLLHSSLAHYFVATYTDPYALPPARKHPSSCGANMNRQQGLTKDDVDFDPIWATLSVAFQEIFAKNASKLSFEELFRNAYKLVLKKKQDLLYDKVVELIKTWLRDTVRVKIYSFITPTLLASALEPSIGVTSQENRVAGERFVKALKDAFSDHQLCTGMITDVLMYMVCSSPPPRDVLMRCL